MHFLIVIGVLAGRLVFLCSILPAVSGFQSLIILPALLKTLTLSVTLAIVLAILILSFFMVTLIGAIGSNRNISENIQLRLQASQRENILKESEERYRHIFNNAPLGILHYDLNSQSIACNQAVATILGSTKEKLIGLNINDSLGHIVGDEILKLLAGRIIESISHEEIAARMGGDELVVIMFKLPAEPATEYPQI